MPKKLTIVTSAFRCERYLRSYLDNMTGLVNLPEIRVILVLNEPSDTERQLADDYQRRHPDVFEIIALARRESIGASTNRGLRLAQTPYVTYADVDDVRVPDCYVRQIATLDEHREADFTYGDFVMVDAYGKTDGRLVKTPAFDQKKFTRGSYVGPNHFFRRELLEVCGYWDEQLRSGGDFDFQVRAAFNATFRRTEGVLLYYTSANVQSASSSRLQPVERTLIELRYGIYDKVDFRYLREALAYRPYAIESLGTWSPVGTFVPDYEEMLCRRDPLWRRACRQYLWESLIHEPARQAGGTVKQLWKNQ